MVWGALIGAAAQAGSAALEGGEGGMPAGMDSMNEIRSGKIEQGGLTLNPKQGIDNDLIIKGAVITAGVLLTAWAVKKMRKT